MNRAHLLGRITKDPELRFTNEGLAVARFTVAINRVGKDTDKADFLPVVVFGKQAEACANYLEKGLRVAVNGRIQTGSYTNKDGQKVYTTDVVAENVEFIDWRETKNAEETTKADTVEPPEGFVEINDDDLPF